MSYDVCRCGLCNQIKFGHVCLAVTESSSGAPGRKSGRTALPNLKVANNTSPTASSVSVSSASREQRDPDNVEDGEVDNSPKRQRRGENDGDNKVPHERDCNSSGDESVSSSEAAKREAHGRVPSQGVDVDEEASADSRRE